MDQSMICKQCGSVLSAVTFTCVRGEYCKPTNPAQTTCEVFPGYVVEKLPETPGKICFAYKIIGPRKTFMLMRNGPNPKMLFVCPEGRVTGKIRGYEWFTDKDGTLKPCR